MASRRMKLSRLCTFKVGRIPARRQCEILLLIPCLLAVSAARAALPDIIDKIRPAIVAVGTMQPTRRPPAQFQAGGFAVANGQYGLTNVHVVPEVLDTQQKEYLAVFTGRGQRFEGQMATAVAMDREHDLTC